MDTADQLRANTGLKASEYLEVDNAKTKIKLAIYVA